jgi:hypothetical protein
MIYVGDVGVQFTINTHYDLTGNTSVILYLIDPTGAIVPKTPAVATPSNGIITYTTTAETELYIAGDWTIQCVVWFGSNKPMFTDYDTFTVAVPPANPTGTII